MLKRHALALVSTCPLLILALSACCPQSTPPATPTEPVRIMPLGDSITGSPGCWRAILWNKLQDGGYTHIDFVGTLSSGGCGRHDGDHEGHGGYLATNVATQGLLPDWLSTTNPDIIMMHFGTNDIWSDIPALTILDTYDIVVDQMREHNPHVKILVAQIIPMDPDKSCPGCDQRVIALNDAIPGWASGKSTDQSPIIVVDQWTGFDTDTDTYDGVHPNNAGNQKIADRWYSALASLLAK
jgi:lysophospholipase L1-like esterase